MMLLFLGDPDKKRKQVVREKTAQYLLQAEKIYNQHLASKSAELSLWDVRIRLFAIGGCKFINSSEHFSVLYFQQYTARNLLKVLLQSFDLKSLFTKETCPIIGNKYFEETLK
jgi:hypothetical protein